MNGNTVYCRNNHRGGQPRPCSQGELFEMAGRTLMAMEDFYGKDLRSIDHAYHVCGLVRTIGLSLRMDLEKMKILECAAALHDIGIKQSMDTYGCAKGKFHESVGVSIAGELLECLGFPRSIIDRVLFLIGHHHSLHPEGGAMLRVLYEAEVIAELRESVEGDPALPGELLGGIITTKTGQEIIKTRYGILPLPPRVAAVGV